MKPLATLDVGSSQVKGALFDGDGTLVAWSTAESAAWKFHRHQVEQDGWAMLSAVEKVLDDLSRHVPKQSWCGLGFTGQRGTFMVCGESGQPLRAVMSWMDRRAGWGRDRWDWLKTHEGEVARQTRKVRSLSSWIVESLTGHPLEAAATLSPEWNQEIHGDLSQLDGPQLVEAGTVTQVAAGETLPHGLPFVICGGDKNCEHLAAGVMEPGDAAISFGTALSLGTILPEGLEPLAADDSAQTRGYVAIPASRSGYINLEAGLPFGGLGPHWLRKLLHISGDDHRCDPALPAEGDPFFLPFVAGSLFHDDGQGVLFGLAPDTTPDMIHAAWTEGVVMELRRGRRLLERLTAREIKVISLTGGAARLDSWFPQWLADGLEARIDILGESFQGLRGAAMVASMALGWTDSWSQAHRKFRSSSCGSILPTREVKGHWDKRYACYETLCRALFG